MTLISRDKKLIWHPFTQEKTAAPPLPIVRAEGSWLYDEKGRGLLDLISSWWVNLHGHAHPVIAKAIYEQALTLEQVIFAGFTHSPAVSLCEKLKQHLPQSLARFFFSDNGSTAVETALKMAYQYWWNQSYPEKKMFLAFDGGYHGDTFGAMSVGAFSGFHDPFSELFFPVANIPFPATFKDDNSVELREAEALQKLAEHLKKYSGNIAAMILEPLVQGAAGMRMCRPEFLSQLVDILKSHGILIIFDEVMTGFFRTGTLFAFHQTNVEPDFLCLSKGLTGGFLPLALTVTTEKIYTAFLGEHFSKAFAHGHSYTANPLGCAAALASFELLFANDTLTAIRAIDNAHRDGLNYLQTNTKTIGKIRQRGTIAAFDVLTSEFNSADFKKQMLKQNLIIRPLGNSIYLLPPYSTTSEMLNEAYSTISDYFNS